MHRWILCCERARSIGSATLLDRSRLGCELYQLSLYIPIFIYIIRYDCKFHPQMMGYLLDWLAMQIGPSLCPFSSLGKIGGMSRRAPKRRRKAMERKKTNISIYSNIPS